MAAMAAVAELALRGLAAAEVVRHQLAKLGLTLWLDRVEPVNFSRLLKIMEMAGIFPVAAVAD